MHLPGHTDRLLIAVLAANPVWSLAYNPLPPSLCLGLPLAVPFSKPGTAATRLAAPSRTSFSALYILRRLPLTFPIDIKDNPAFPNYWCKGGRTLYREDVLCRSIDITIPRRSRWRLGLGIDYRIRSSSSQPRVEVSDSNEDKSRLKVSVDMKNTGKTPGEEVVEIYISQRNPSIRRPAKELKGFKKAFLETWREKGGGRCGRDEVCYQFLGQE